MNEPPQPTTLARVRASKDYHDACERLANASVAKRQADAEFRDAMQKFTSARGAAISHGITT